MSRSKSGRRMAGGDQKATHEYRMEKLHWIEDHSRYPDGSFRADLRSKLDDHLNGIIKVKSADDQKKA